MINDKESPFIQSLKPAPKRGGFAMEGYWVWCGSVIKGDEGKYHMFASRWPKFKQGFFQPYPLYSEIVRAEANRPDGPFQFKEVVLQDRGPDYWDGRMTHNPAILKYKDVYLLFYIGSTFEGDKSDSDRLLACETARKQAYGSIRIGLAIAKSVKGPWIRPDVPLLKPRPGKWDSRVVTNPAPCLMEDGAIHLLYRSNTRQGPRLGVAKASNYDSPFRRLTDDFIASFGMDSYVEDPFLWHDGNRFNMLAKDLTGNITGEYHAGVFAHSQDCLRWMIGNPPKAYSRKILWDDGTLSVQGSLERPQLLFEHGRPVCLYAATGDGKGGFDNFSKSWNLAIPIKHRN